MFNILQGLQIVEASAFVAAPLCGLTLAQMGADVVRFDPINGGLDANRWPVTEDGKSLYWVGLNKGKRSLAVNTRAPQGQRDRTQADYCQRRRKGNIRDQLPGPQGVDELRVAQGIPEGSDHGEFIGKPRWHFRG